MGNDTGTLVNWVWLGLAVAVFLGSLPFAFNLANSAGGLLGTPMLGELLLFAYAFGVFFLALVPLWRRCAGLPAEDAH